MPRLPDYDPYSTTLATHDDINQLRFELEQSPIFYFERWFNFSWASRDRMEAKLRISDTDEDDITWNDAYNEGYRTSYAGLLELKTQGDIIYSNRVDALFLKAQEFKAMAAPTLRDIAPENWGVTLWPGFENPLLHPSPEDPLTPI